MKFESMDFPFVFLIFSDLLLNFGVLRLIPAINMLKNEADVI